MTSYIPIPRQVDLSLDKKLIWKDQDNEVDLIQFNEKGQMEHIITLRMEDLVVAGTVFGRIVAEHRQKRNEL